MIYQTIVSRIYKHARVFRYLISGGMAAGVNFLSLYIFTEWFGIYYLLSSVLSFVLAVVVSFVFQKFWTFQDHSRDFIHKQAWTYLFVAVTNTIINTIFVYSLVEYAGFHYLWAQFVSNVIIACESFFVYKKFIFHTKII